MAQLTRPLLAASLEDINTLKFPILATQKLDGIRCLKVNGQVVTRKFKELPNTFIREFLTSHLPDGIDGEIMLNSVAPKIVKPSRKTLFDDSVSEPTAVKGPVTFNAIQSEVMSFEGTPDFVFCAFDFVQDNLDKPYFERVQDLKKWYDNHMLKSMQQNMQTLGEAALRIKILLPVELHSIEDVLGYEAKCLELGYEGVMIRDPLGKYKCGRSTLKEGILVKIKQFKDAEATVIGFTEKLKNENPQEKNEFGLAKRSSKKEGLVPADTLGALMVKDCVSGIEFEVGSGFDDATKKEIWTNQAKYLGKIVTYKFQPIGVLEKPRFPVFKGFRDERDM